MQKMEGNRRSCAGSHCAERDVNSKRDEITKGFSVGCGKDRQGSHLSAAIHFRNVSVRNRTA